MKLLWSRFKLFGLDANVAVAEILSKLSPKVFKEQVQNWKHYKEDACFDAIFDKYEKAE